MPLGGVMHSSGKNESRDTSILTWSRDPKSPATQCGVNISFSVYLRTKNDCEFGLDNARGLTAAYRFTKKPATPYRVYCMANLFAINKSPKTERR